MAVPGLVTRTEQAVVHGQSVGWDAVPVEAMLRDMIDLPIFVDNGAKTLGQAEKWFGAARGTDDAIIVLLGMGLGTCIISNGEVYRGATGSAGEWGHTTVVVGGRRCRCGANGCLEAYVGAGADRGQVRRAEWRRCRPSGVAPSPGEPSPGALTWMAEGTVAALICRPRPRSGQRPGPR